MYAIFRNPRLGMVIITVLLWTLEGGLVCGAWITLTRRTEKRTKTFKTSEVPGPRVIRNRGPPGDITPICTPGPRRGMATCGAALSLEQDAFHAHRM